MTWNCVAPLAFTARRRFVVSAIVYGLSLSIRFTSATGEQVEIPSPATAFIMARDDSPTSYNGWPLRPTEPIALRLGWPLAPRRCHAACERTTPVALTPSCGAP